MTLDPAATPGTTGDPAAGGSGTAVPPGTTAGDPAGGSVGDPAASERERLLQEQLEAERNARIELDRKNAQLLAEKSNVEAERARLRADQARNEALDRDLEILNSPGDHDPVVVAQATARIAIAAANEANQRALGAERRAEQVEKRLTTSVPEPHRAGVEEFYKTGKYRSYEEAASFYELEARRNGTWEQPKPATPTPGAATPAASPAQRPLGTVTRSAPPSAPPLPKTMPESEYVALKSVDPARHEQLRILRKSGQFQVTPG